MKRTDGQWLAFFYTLPDGSIASRTSRTMTYTHVVVVRSAGHTDEGVWSWSQSREGAEKTARQYRNWGHEARVDTVDVA